MASGRSPEGQKLTKKDMDDLLEAIRDDLPYKDYTAINKWLSEMAEQKKQPMPIENGI